MADITYAPLTADNFNVFSLDKFIRRQHVRQCWRRVDGALVLRPVEYIEDWTLEERRSTAAEVLDAVRDGGAAFGAFSGGEAAGFAALAGARLGSREQYADLALFYVSEPFQGQGIGGRRSWPPTGRWAAWRRRSPTPATRRRSPATCSWKSGWSAREHGLCSGSRAFPVPVRRGRGRRAQPRFRSRHTWARMSLSTRKASSSL